MSFSWRKALQQVPAAAAGAFAAFFFAGAAAGWFHGASAPAWVQAVGSVAAILLAVAIPFWQREMARLDAESDREWARRHLQEQRDYDRMQAGEHEARVARGYVVHILNSLELYSEQISPLAENCAKVPDDYCWGNLRGVFQKGLALPPVLDGIGPETHKFGPMAIHVQRILVLQQWLASKANAFDLACLRLESNQFEEAYADNPYSQVGGYITQVGALYTAVGEGWSCMRDWLWQETNSEGAPN